MLKFVRKFIDWRVKQKILFNIGCKFGSFSIWLSSGCRNFQPNISTPQKKNLSTHPFPDYHLASYIKLSNMFNIIIILFLHFFIQLESFQFSKLLPRNQIRLMLRNVSHNLNVRSLNFITSVHLSSMACRPKTHYRYRTDH